MGCRSVPECSHTQEGHTCQRFVEIQKVCYLGQRHIATSPFILLQGAAKSVKAQKRKTKKSFTIKKTYFLDAGEATVGP